MSQSSNKEAPSFDSKDYLELKKEGAIKLRCDGVDTYAIILPDHNRRTGKPMPPLVVPVRLEEMQQQYAENVQSLEKRIEEQRAALAGFAALIADLESLSVPNE